MARFMPDRERRHLLQFYLFPSMDYGLRLAWSGGLLFLGVAGQILWFSPEPALLLSLSVPLLLAASSLLLVQGYDLTPQHGLIGGDWEKTTRERFRHVRALETQVRTWDETLLDVTCTSGCVTLGMLVLVIAGVTFVLNSLDDPREWGTLFAIDAAVLILPHWVTGTRRGWRPVALRQQLDAFEAALREMDAFEEPPCQIQPMFQMTGEGDQRTPVAARVFVRFPDGPEDFLGVQFQVSLNDVQGTKYPYLYAVIIARRAFELHRNHLERIRSDLAPDESQSSGFLSFFGVAGPSLTVESSGEGDVEVIVIRQTTTKKTGYHTDAAACRWITRAAWQSVTRILQATPVA